VDSGLEDTGLRDPAIADFLTGRRRMAGYGAKCNVHNLWINLLITTWGREVNGL
jgi:hypothetical protein